MLYRVCVRGAVLRSRRRCCTVYSCTDPRVRIFLTECKFLIFRTGLQRYITMTGHMLRTDLRVWAHQDARRCTIRTQNAQTRRNAATRNASQAALGPAAHRRGGIRWRNAAKRPTTNAPCRRCLPRSRRAVLQPAELWPALRTRAAAAATAAAADGRGRSAAAAHIGPARHGTREAHVSRVPSRMQAGAAAPSARGTAGAVTSEGGAWRRRDLHTA